jgi:Peptidase family M1 domain
VTHSPLCMGPARLANHTKRAMWGALACIIATAVSLPAQPHPLPNQGPAAPRVPARASTSPPARQANRYWQQRADYTVVARLNETRGLVEASGVLHYVNASPDTLRELWLHQHLNAFRPGSRWSARDSAQGVNSFQSLADPEYGFERFTAPPRLGSTVLSVEYPLAPDSTVVRLPLPRALRPGDSLNLTLQWEARPSTRLRRQGRKGRHYDFAQWFPKIAVYDRDGWKPNALVRQGELYGEFGTFDVTFLLPADQVIAATGVPVEGDPGWSRVKVPGSAAPRLAKNAYGKKRGPARVEIPDGYRAVRFLAEQVHHFGWSVSPDYRYEGAAWVRRGSPGTGRRRAPDTVSLHVLFERWQPGRTLGDLRHALQWLERLYGPYAWPQLTVAERLEGSGTEFPMLVMDGEEDRSLVVHEAGHQFTYGMLANNEWQSAWMDEGFTTYSEYWAKGEARVPLALERAAHNWFDVRTIADTAVRRRISAVEALTESIEAPTLRRPPPPLGLRADLFTSKDEYDEVVYDRAAGMYSALHDVMGDATFRQFLKRYVSRWKFRHVDRQAMQQVAEDVTKAPLGWFFDQWINTTGTIDYRLDSLVVRPRRNGRDSLWQVTVQLQRQGVYRHPMPVGIRTATGWTVVRGDALLDRQTVTFALRTPPLEVWLDPFGTVESRTTSQSRISLPHR